MSCGEGAGRERTCGQRAAGVETKPADPKQAGANETQHQAVRGHDRLRIAQALV